MPIVFNGGKGTSIDPNDFIKNQTGTVQTPASFKISGSGTFGDPATDPQASSIGTNSLQFVNNGDDVHSTFSAELLSFDTIATATRLGRWVPAPAVGFPNLFSGQPFQFLSTLQMNVAPVDPTDGVRLEDLISGPIPGTPAIAAGSALGAGTVQIFGNNFMGQVQFTTGAIPLPSGVLCTITFGGGAAYVTASTPLISPAQAGSDVNGIALVGVAGGSNFWNIIVNAVALAANTSYRFNYIVGGVN